jgi:hypothetical protein
MSVVQYRLGDKFAFGVFSSVVTHHFKRQQLQQQSATMDCG